MVRNEVHITYEVHITMPLPMNSGIGEYILKLLDNDKALNNMGCKNICVFLLKTENIGEVIS